MDISLIGAIQVLTIKLYFYAYTNKYINDYICLIYLEDSHELSKKIFTFRNNIDRSESEQPVFYTIIAIDRQKFVAVVIRYLYY